MSKSLILYAPSIHTGGGLILLRALLRDWPHEQILKAVLDIRAKENINLPILANVSWVRPTILSRFKAELRLWVDAGPKDLIFCFHGLPPILKNRGRVILFLQNRLLLGFMQLRDFPLRVALRLSVERFISYRFRHNVSEFIVQTASMGMAVSRWHGSDPKVIIQPFVEKISRSTKLQIEWDFVYPSDGLPHKNHGTLLEAWSILAKENIYPRLAITLGERDLVLSNKINKRANDEGLNIYNFGHMDHDRVVAVYLRSRALIFPSLGESFGLPLIEATQLDLPILAPEMDYVRDVCEPVETFDALSPTSIARAVKRFLDIPPSMQPLASAADFWAILSIDSKNSDL
jgi:glycosyltransferase involved in cell wall biosynthesis